MVKVAKQAPEENSIYGKEKSLKTQRTLKKMRRESEEEKASSLAEKLNLRYIDLNLIPVSEDSVRVIPKEDSIKYNLAAFQKIGTKVKIASIDPTDKGVREYLDKLAKDNGWKITLFIVSTSSLKKLSKLYEGAIILEDLDFLHMSLSGKDLEDFEEKFGKLLALKDRIEDISTTEVVNTLMASSIAMKSSDIHFEPEQNNVRIRFRIDGILQEIGRFPKKVYKSILSRVKMMAKMKINIRDIAQDGHFTIIIGEEDALRKQGKKNTKKSKDTTRIDIRANIIPGNYGESIVMRLLNQADVMLTIEDLGLKGLAYDELQKQVSKPNGTILTTGPTGSGKTTTLYALINKLNTPDIKIITIEDPIEYQIDGISQTQVNKSGGYTFADGLRAIVRQDPDVILIGEIRDDETAEVSINAALTGHLVLSTLHTNSAPASIPRLIELGVKPSLIPSAVNGIIAQRLVRRLCPHCKQGYAPAKETVESIKKILSMISPKAKLGVPKDIPQLYKTVGCARCHNIGYQGRVGIFEFLTITSEIERLILDMASETEIVQEALLSGMITMTQDGMLKALEGITTMEEVWRVTGQAEFLEEIYETLSGKKEKEKLKVDF